MSELGRSLAAGLAVLGLLFLIFTALPITQPAQGADIEAYATLDQTSQEMPVSAGQDRVVSFTGVITCNLSGMGAGFEEVRVSLRGRTNDGWSVAVTPGEFTFNAGDDPQTFTVSVNAPDGSLPQTTAEILTIDGSADEMIGGFVISSVNIMPVTATITIQQYYGVDATCLAPSKEGGSSTTVQYQVLVKNTGNGLDVFYVNRIDYSKNPDMPERGFKVTTAEEEFTIPARGEFQVIVNVETPSDIPDSKVYNFTMYFRSKGAEDSGSIASDAPIVLVLRTTGGLGDFVGNINFGLVIGGIVFVIFLALVVAVFVFVMKKRKKAKARRAKFAVKYGK